MALHNNVTKMKLRFNRFLRWVIAGVVLVCHGLSSAENRLNENWSLVGEGRFKFAFWSIYDAYLYTPTGQFEHFKQTNTVQTVKTQSLNPAIAVEQLPAPFYLKLRYLREIEKADLIENTFDQWQKQAVDVAKLKRYKQVLNDTWPDRVIEGETLAIMVTADASQFYFNETPIGSKLDQEFGFIFAGIWLATTTTKPKLRAQLIGRNKKHPN